MILFRNFNILDPYAKFEKGQTSVFVDNSGLIQPIPDPLPEFGCRIVEGNQRLLVPGFTDLHAFIGEPGFEYRETVQTGAKAALAGGFTTLFSYPNTNPVVDSLQVYEYIKLKTDQEPVNFIIVPSVSVDTKGEMMSPVKSFIERGIRAFSDGIHPIQNSIFLKRVAEYVSMFDGIIIQNPSENLLQNDGVLHEGYQSIRLGLPGMPAIAESVMVHRDGEVARAANCRFHFNNLSTEASIGAFEYHKTKSPELFTAGISPFYFSFHEQTIRDYDTNFKIMPPIRPKSDLDAVINAVKDGLIDMIISSHTPHSEIEKTTDFIHAPIGAVSLETTFSAAYTHLVKTNVISLDQLMKLMVVNPRKYFGLDANPIQFGAMADFVIIDQHEHYTVTKDSLVSKSKNTPFLSHDLFGVIDMVFTNNQLFTFHETSSSDYTTGS